MTNQQHPITPPPELVGQWLRDRRLLDPLPLAHHYLATRAAQWGSHQRGTINEAQLQERADQELEACCEWAKQFNYDDEYYQDKLRAARRPKPPSLKEQALAALDDAVMRGDCITISDAVPTIRRALEQLND
jgi:hypothetical protein